MARIEVESKHDRDGDVVRLTAGDLTPADEKSDNTKEALNGIQDPKFTQKLRVSTSDNTPIGVSNAFLKRFFQLDLDSLQIEELMWLAGVAFIISTQGSEEQARQQQQQLHDSGARKSAEAARAHLNWAMTIAVLTGGAPLTPISTPLFNQLGQGMNPSPYLDGLKNLLTNMTPQQAENFSKSLPATAGYLDALSRSGVTRTGSADNTTKDALRLCREELQGLVRDLQAQTEHLRMLSDKKLQAVQGGTR
jgi:hypothetical protein